MVGYAARTDANAIEPQRQMANRLERAARKTSNDMTPPFSAGPVPNASTMCPPWLFRHRKMFFGHGIFRFAIRLRDMDASATETLAAALPAALPRLWRFAMRLTRRADDAEDLVQRTCLRALERQHQWQTGGTPLPWLFAIMHSIWCNEIQSRRLRQASSLEDDEVVDVVDHSQPDPQTQAMYRQVVAAVFELPEAQRMVMLLIAVEGLSYREAADILNIPIGTVMSRLARARLTVGARFDARSPKSGSASVKGDLHVA